METWRKNLYIVWIAQFITMMGMSMIVPFLPFFIRELGVRDEADIARWSGIVFSGPFIVSFFTTPFWGTLGDRFGRKLIMIRAIFGLGIAQVLTSLSQNVYQLFIFRVIQGAISGFIPSALAFVSAETPYERKSYAIGVLQTATSSGQLFGPLFGGVLADLIGYRHIFQLTGLICFLAGFLLIFGVVETKRNNFENKNSELKTLIENYHFAFVDRKIRTGLVLIFLAQITVMIVQPIFALFVEYISGDVKHISTLAGVAFSIASAFTVLSAPFWGKKNDRDVKRFGIRGYKQNLIFSFLGAGISFIIQGISKSIFLVIFSRALFGFFLGGMTPVLYSFVSRNVDENKQGGVMGIASSFTTLSNVIGPGLGGLIAGFWGLRAGFYLSAFLAFVSVVIVMQMGVKK
ncbi:MFS transporter [Candidatus Kryptobacter tengchongensis]|uniref:Predicted arabinose efflux permease, MFS family n=2 Tax=Kryptobacter tengchongensis TaxID=1643429 RepID=A0A656D7H2_KRYT1|nr:MFS transporter [Candidatus Kryptobacter tengchongensis]CUT01413.1 Predicted arabinose efflux permease, MFS family [Candidatus Kryptobacter tengchongensis]CUT02951.1 Predicted arabinose efflux permease, MFS family [Candidatus Kryptobacter tengchongensis]